MFLWNLFSAAIIIRNSCGLSSVCIKIEQNKRVWKFSVISMHKILIQNSITCDCQWLQNLKLCNQVLEMWMKKAECYIFQMFFGNINNVLNIIHNYIIKFWKNNDFKKWIPLNQPYCQKIMEYLGLWGITPSPSKLLML